MALSQIQCLDDNHVNPRTHESKPEFFYCEDQRLALEALLRDGREAFVEYLETRGLRAFLSDPELETLAGEVEPFDPGSELLLDNVKDDPAPLSLHYWPELSDTSIPQMDLGWPNSDSYRGVTRTSVYTQPPLDGQAHIKEVVRKMITQAQKVIAVVMDVFTDVDIFRDLLDAAFKRKVSVYILLERTTLPHFLSMCQRANMHAGHLKHLRVRCSEGTEFHTRHCTKVRGRTGHRFMFIDGDKAVSGSYSFTWMSSRLDRNLITVTTGQAVDAFDQLFRFLYMTSGYVELQQVVTEPEPEPERRPQLPTVAPPSADVARKMYNPKYALVALSNPSPTTSVGHGSPKESESEENSKKKGRRRARDEVTQDAPPLHPGLTNLEKAYLISYLPTWPEPDPPSDVIGFINIRDANRPTQVHLQRSEMFETSQAIRFSSPISKPQETLPELAKPRQLTSKREEMGKLQSSEIDELMVDRAKPAQQNVTPDGIRSKDKTPEHISPPCSQRSESDEDKTKALDSEIKLFSNTVTSPDAGHNKPCLSAHTPPQSSCEAPTPNKGIPSPRAQTVSTENSKSDSVPESNTKKEEETATSLNTKRTVVYRTDIEESNITEISQLGDATDSNTEDTQEKTVASHTDSHTKAVNMQPEMTQNLQNPSVHGHISTPSALPSECSTFLSKNNLITTVHSSTATSSHTSVSSSSSHSSFPSPSSSFTSRNPPFPSSSSPVSSYLTSGPPIPKPRTVQLVLKDSSVSNAQTLPEISVITRPKTSTGPQAVHSEAPAATKMPASPVKGPETAPELQSNSASKTGDKEDTENTNNPKETPQQKKGATSLETKDKEADGHHDGRAGAPSVTGTKLQTQSNVLITDAPKAASENINEIIPKDVDSKTLASTNSETDRVQTDIKTPKSCELAEVPNVTQYQINFSRAREPQRLSHRKLTSRDIDMSESVDSSKAPGHSPSHSPHILIDDAAESMRTSVADTLSQQGKQAQFASARRADCELDTAKQNTRGAFQEQTCKTRSSSQIPVKALRLQVSDKHAPDLHSSTPERDSRSLAVTVRSPILDGYSPGSATSGSQSISPDPRSYTPDFRTPTPDISDGYVSPRGDSTTSEEYYECSDSPFHEPVFDLSGYQNYGTEETFISPSHSSTPNAATTATNPAYLNYSLSAVKLSSTDQNSSRSETLSKTFGVPSSSLIGTKGQRREPEDTNEENGKEQVIKRGELSHAEKRTEQESQGNEGTGRDGASGTVGHFKQEGDRTETAEKGNKAQSPQKKRVQNQLAPDRVVDGGVTAGKSACQETERRQLSAEELKPKVVSSEGERKDKTSSGRAKGLNQVTLRSSDAETSESQSARETKKLMYSSPKPRQLKQQDSGPFSFYRPQRSPRLLSASQLLEAHPSGSRELKLTESKTPPSSPSNLSSPRRHPSRTPSPVTVGSAAGRKQVFHRQHSLPSRQPPAPQIRAKTGQPQSQTAYPKPQASFLHTHSKLQSLVPPQLPIEMVSAQEAQEHREGSVPFHLTAGRLYSLKGHKDKSKAPAQSKRGRASSPGKGRKSTS
ncbi:uncharacterized protein [Leuresthes tenuis]|uniref:uncharacterized protein n=1 Tax=Leuresthes tenuis TaxID=355514 RepID=UPI003B5067CD